MEGKVEFQNVKFSYPLNPDSNIFESLSFSIEPGKILALVGYSGSGKSTIVKLITGEERANIGSITVGNKTLESLSRIDYYNQGEYYSKGSLKESYSYSNNGNLFIGGYCLLSKEEVSKKFFIGYSHESIRIKASYHI